MSDESSAFRPDRLAARRRALGYSREELGRLLLGGHPAKAIADLETGRAQPTPLIVLGLSRSFGCKPADLFSDEEDPLLAAALAERQRWEREDAAAPDISDATIDLLRRLLPRRDPRTAGRAGQSPAL